MRGRPRALLLTGAGLLALGALAPWAQAQTQAGVTVEHGGAVVLVGAAMLLLLKLRGRGASLVGVMFAVWTAGVMYTLPGDLVAQGAREAQMSLGAYAALAGAILMTLARARPSEAGPRSARRSALTMACAAIACGLVSAAWTGSGSPPTDGSWAPHARDDISVMSSDGRARAVATLTWLHGTALTGYRHRGTFTPGSVVTAPRSVRCIWFRVDWGYPLGVTSNGYTVRCRARGARKPVTLPLVGVGYAKGLLNSMTITLCVSAAREDGPRFCGIQKATYSSV